MCLCLDVIGAFIAWIDIGLIANDRFVQVFINFLSMPSLRESTCDCINQIISKGMDPVAKVKLVESYVTVLEQAGVLNFTGVSFAVLSYFYSCISAAYMYFQKNG